MFRPLIVAIFREVFYAVYNIVNLHICLCSCLLCASNKESTEHDHESFIVATRFFLKGKSDQNVKLITNLYQIMKLKMTISTSTILSCKVH